MSKPLREMSVVDVIEEVDGHIDFINDDYKQIYVANLRDNNINGKVLACCDLSELKSELQMTFGDWQVFKDWILKQRELNTKYKSSKKQLLQKQSVAMPVVSETTSNNFYELKQQGMDKGKTPERGVTTELTNRREEVLSQSLRSGRKVEFFISPVVEATPLVNRPLSPQHPPATPTKGILHSNVSLDSAGPDLHSPALSAASHEPSLLAESTVSKQGSLSSLKSSNTSIHY